MDALYLPLSLLLHPHPPLSFILARIIMQYKYLLEPLSPLIAPLLPLLPCIPPHFPSLPSIHPSIHLWLAPCIPPSSSCLFLLPPIGSFCFSKQNATPASVDQHVSVTLPCASLHGELQRCVPVCECVCVHVNENSILK